MKFDTYLPFSVVVMVVLSLLFPFAADWHLPLLGGALVTLIENAQALWLLFGALFTAWYIKPLSRPEGEKQFWMWAVLWWMVLLGRSTSWGRAYFPEQPQFVFRVISVVLIGGLALSLLSGPLRKDIVRRVKEVTMPLWLLVVTICSFIISDTVEHHRLLAPLFVHNSQYADLMEELYEIPFMVGLLLVTYYFMKMDKSSDQLFLLNISMDCK